VEYIDFTPFQTLMASWGVYLWKKP